MTTRKRPPAKKKRPPEMTMQQYRAVLDALGLSYPAAAKHLGVSPRAVAGYGIGDNTVPPPTAKLLRLWLLLKTDPTKASAPF